MIKNMEHPTKKQNRGEFVRTLSLRLPTPPPDPVQITKLTSDETATATTSNKVNVEKENEFLEYLNSLQMPPKTPTNEKQPLQRTTSIFAPAIAAENAFDHLDKLYKLMEQLLNLREQNTKLQRRVRDLEHLRHLQSMHQQTTRSVLKGEDTEMPELDDDDDSILAEALLENMFTSARIKRNPKYKSPSQFRFRQSILRPQRDRSCSLAVDDLTSAEKCTQQSVIPRNLSGKSLPENTMLRKPAKVSKWTKVKAAFKWEKASSAVTGAKSQDSGIGGMQPINNEIARYLRVPSNCENAEPGASPADSVLSGSWQGVHGLSTSSTLSPASSTDDLNPSTISEHRCISRTGSAENGGNRSRKQFGTFRTSDEEEGDRRSRSLDYTACAYDTSNKDELLKLQTSKLHKSPWGKMKDIIQTQKDSLKRKQHRLSTRSDDYKMEFSAGSDQEDVFEPLTITPANCPAVKITSIDDTTNVHGKSLPLQSINDFKNEDDHNIPPAVIARYQRVAAEEEKSQMKHIGGSPRSQRRVSKWTKVKKAFLTTASISRNDEECRTPPSSPVSKNYHFFTDSPTLEYKSFEMNDNKSHGKKAENDVESTKLKEEIYKNYEQLQNKLSQEFQEKLQEWEKLKTITSNCVSTQATTPNSSMNEEQRDADFVRKMEEWEKIKCQNNLENSKRKNLQMTSEENLPADFRKKLQEWQKMKKLGLREDDTRRKKNEWQLWRSNSSNKQETQLSEGRQYSEDFLKKLDEWKQIKASHTTNEDQENRKQRRQDNKPPSPSLIRKSSGNKLTRQTKKHKMQEWLEKELQKIEREKQRLEREREKFLEREERLAKLRRSINGPHKKDVLVQTSTGFYRFEGISRKFTQRLYEWEKARGIGPEDSTFALLHSGFNQILPYPSRITRANAFKNEQRKGGKLTRSKSMDSVANLTCDESLITHQPSSLSLNDMEELEIQCLAESHSEQNLHESEEHLEFGEPEAVIVEVEDFIEETAAPLETTVKENCHTPIYQTEVINLCESEKCEAPQVRRSESAKAMSNYNLIQECLNILDKIQDIEETCKNTRMKLNDSIVNEQKKAKENHLNHDRNKGAIPKRKQNNNNQTEELHKSLQETYNQQLELSENLLGKIICFQNANLNATRNIPTTNSDHAISQFNECITQMQDLCGAITTIAEKLKDIFIKRNNELNSSKKDTVQDSNNKLSLEIREIINTLTVRIKELKRSLTYLCAASDMTAPNRRRKESYRQSRKNSLEKRSNEKQTININDTSDEEDYQNNQIILPKRKEKLIKSKSEDNEIINYAKLQVSSMADERKERVKRSYQLHRSAHFAFPSKVEDVERNNDPTKPVFKSNDLKESQEEKSNVIIPINVQYLNATSHESSISSPVSIFVHTTRKLFTPFASEAFDSKQKNDNIVMTSSEQNVPTRTERARNSESPMLPPKKRLVINESTTEETNALENPVSRPATPHLPPLPHSPIAQRREKPITKETSPVIRLMIARYNQKLSEQENAGNKSAGSSGSASPVAWRSPVLERRVKAQTEKYEEGVNKSLQNTSTYSPLFIRKQVQKSASVGVIHPPKFTLPQVTPDPIDRKTSPKLTKGILKSTSMGSMKSNQNSDSKSTCSNPEMKLTEKKSSLKLTIPSPCTEEVQKSSPILQERAHKLQKAKEDFLAQKMETPISAPPSLIQNRDHLLKKRSPRDRLSQVSVESESSCDDSMNCSGVLIKSASAGMINVDEVTYEQFRPEVHSQGYVSLPRDVKKKDGMFGISNLASKFRKVKMRRNKGMNTISTLCRQSLVVDITNDTNSDLNNKSEMGESEKGSCSDMNSPSTSKSRWIKNPAKIFRPK